jgi:hypothetical protein
MAKIIDLDNLIRSTTKDNLGIDGNIWIDTATKQIYLKEYGDLTTDGVTLQCLYSFLKEEWKNDDTLIKFPFPMVAITPEQFEFVNGWRIAEDDDNHTLFLLRDGGFAIKNADGTSEREFFGCITLGEFDDPTSDRAYYQQTADGSIVKDAHFTGPLNEVVEYYRNKTIIGENVGTGDGNTTEFYLKFAPVEAGSYTIYINGTEAANGTDYNLDLITGKITFIVTPSSGAVITADYTSLFDYSDFFKIFLRVEGKKYSQSELSDIGVSSLTYQAYRFPLSNEIDLKITHTDNQIDTNNDGIPDVDPYDNMSITYLIGNGFTVWDSSVSYNVNDVVQGSNGRWYIAVQANTGIDPTTDDGTTWKSYSGERQIGSNYYAFNIIINANTSGTSDNPIAEQIYEFVQFELRQNLDIDAGSGVVIGKIADPLLEFVGDTLVTSKGVFIDNFNATDTNRIEFYDVTNTKRTFPYVAAGTIYFNDNLQADSNAVYVMYFKDPDGVPNSGDEFGTDGAIVVQDKDGNPIQGNVNGQASITFTFDYDGNTQGGRQAGTDADVVVVAIGLDKAQYVEAEGTITRSTANSISLVASLERNFINP